MRCPDGVAGLDALVLRADDIAVADRIGRHPRQGVLDRGGRSDLPGDRGPGGVLYVSGGDRAVHALDARSGLEIWPQVVTGQPGAITVVGDRIYIGTDLGQVIAIGAKP